MRSVKKPDLPSLSVMLDIVHNTVTWNGGRHVFVRRYEVALLHALLRAASSGKAVAAPELQNSVQTLGQTQALNRAQLLRLVNGISGFLAAHPWLGGRLGHPPRKASVGPWRLHLARPVEWQVLDDAAVALPLEPTCHSPEHWPSPRLLAHPGLKELLGLVNQWLTFDALAIYGEVRSALECLPVLESFALTPQTRKVLAIRHIDLLRKSGRFDEALQIARGVAEAPHDALDGALKIQAQQLIMRLRYDQNPAEAWPALLASASYPEATTAACTTTLGEWHNLQALCLRRAILVDSTNGSEQLLRMHTQVLCHFESALYAAFAQKNWDRLHAYLDNIAYHLQKTLALGLCTVSEVCEWYALALACGDKLDSGHDDAWDLIYFGEFWLDHWQAIESAKLDIQHRSSLVSGAMHPRNQDYWEHMVSHMDSGGSPRQIAIALVLYMRWLSALNKSDRLGEAKRKLATLLSKNAGLGAILVANGYQRYLPNDVTAFQCAP